MRSHRAPAALPADHAQISNENQRMTLKPPARRPWRWSDVGILAAAAPTLAAIALIASSYFGAP